MKKGPLLIYLLFAFLYSQTTAFGQSPSPGTEEKGVPHADSIIFRKAFFFISSLKDDRQLAAVVNDDPVFKQISSGLKKNLLQALSCSSAVCYTRALKWSSLQVLQMGDELIALYLRKQTVKKWVRQIRTSGYYARYEGQVDTVFLRNAWTDVAMSINHTLDVYLSGVRPSYPAIDSISFNVASAPFLTRISRLVNELTVSGQKGTNAFDVPARAAIKALILNERDEAARYEPLTAGLNAGPFSEVKAVKWSSYPYSFILVPGSGLKEGGAGLNPMGAYRCQIAVKRYKEGAAPFLIVSGGHVHPYKTPYCEAVEMKKYMVEQLKVPAKAVIIEPHARHTTTNIRNAVRLVYRLGIPATKPALIVTDTSQTKGISVIDKRCLRELSVVPFRDLKQTGPEETEFYPDRRALYLDPTNPLDP